jgi:hypothetical protein
MGTREIDSHHHYLELNGEPVSLMNFAHEYLQDPIYISSLGITGA